MGVIAQHASAAPKTGPIASAMGVGSARTASPKPAPVPKTPKPKPPPQYTRKTTDSGFTLGQKNANGGVINDPRAGHVGFDANPVTPANPNLSAGPTPTFGNLSANKTGFTPEAAANAARQSSNVINQYMTAQQQKGLNVLNDSLNQSNQLYNQARNDANLVGANAYQRIDRQLANNVGAGTQSLISRGLGNSTVVDTMQRGAQRDAADERVGVDEMRARAMMGVDTGQADAQARQAGAISQYLMGYTPQDAGAQAATNLVGYKKPYTVGDFLGGIGGQFGGALAGGAGAALAGMLF